VSFAVRVRYLDLLLRRAVSRDRVVEERVLNVDEHADGGIGARKLFDREARLKERPARAAVRLGNVDSHQTHLEQLGKDRGVVPACRVHRAGERRDLGLSELVDGIAEQSLLFRENGQRRRTSTHGHRRLLAGGRAL
jgi:hypothetical protein